MNCLLTVVKIYLIVVNLDKPPARFARRFASPQCGMCRPFKELWLVCDAFYTKSSLAAAFS